jgi:hypothetical protein
MSRSLEFKRGTIIRGATTQELSSISGSAGELFVDTSKGTIVVMDGSTSGGLSLATENSLSSLSTVATSGSYNDLSDKPTIPSLTGYATETYVNTQVANLVDFAPNALDTLNKLAAALGDDPNFATTITNSLGTKFNSSDFNSTFDTRLGTKSTTDITEGTNLYYTDARVDDRVSSLLVAGTNVSLSYDDNANTLTISADDTSVNWSEIQDKPDPVITVTLTGDVTGTGDTTLTDLASGTISFATTIAANSVALGTDTTGEYIATIAGTTNQVTVSGSGSETAAVTLSLPQNIHTGATPQFAGATLTGALAMGSSKITGLATPTDATDATTKQYVDEVAQGLKAAPAVEVATTANLTATYSNGTAGVGATLTSTSNGAFPIIDGITVSSTATGQNGVLVKNQTNAAHNGRYNLTQVGNGSTPWVLTRCGVCDEASEIPGSYVFVKAGTAQSSTGWVAYVANPSTYVVGTDSIAYFQFSGAGTFTAGTGLTLTGTTFSVNASQTQVTAVGTLTSGAWNASVIDGQYGGTGVANTGKTITLGGSLTTSGAHTTTLTTTGNTSVTLPTTGTLATIDGTETFTNKTLTSPVITGVSPTITLTGDVTGTGTLTNLGSVSFATTIAANSVALGTDTTGNYVADVTAGTGITVTHAAGEGSSAAIAVDTTTIATKAYVDSQILTKDNTDEITEGTTNLYFTNDRARLSLSAGTGISYSTSTGVVTNSAPDQTVAITGAGGAVVTGTYPNFTVTTPSGTVTSVGGTGTVSGLTLTGTVTSTGNLTLGGTLSVTPSNFASQTANTVLAAPNASNGVPTFRALVASDIPTLNQNTTGSAGSVANTLTIGTGLSGTSYNGSAAVTIALANTAVTAGSYTTANITVDAQGRITAASNGAAGLTTTDDTTTNATYYPVVVTTVAGSTARTSSTKLSFNPSTGTLTATALNTSSDENLKTNIKKIINPMEVLNQVDGVGFNFIDSGKKSYGVIAQRLEQVLPELVTTNEDGNKSVNYLPIIGFLIEAVKEQQKQIDSLIK